MNDSTPKWLLNKRRYNLERERTLKIKKIPIELPPNEVDGINKLLKEKGMTKIGLIKRIIKKYK